MKLVEDRRIAGRVRYHLLAEGEDLPQVPPDVLRCVAFLSPAKDDDPDATAFFVEVYRDDGARDPGPIEGVYVVTAKHILNDYPGDEAWMRVNLKAGGVAPIPTKIRDWTQHPEADIAIHPWPLEYRPFDIEPFPLMRRVTQSVIDDWLIGPGDEVFMSGLFWQHSGETKNAPIVRVGNIAAMRGDKVRTTNHGEMDAYLVEVRSLGGLSGSPVFFNGTGLRNVSRPARSLSGRPLAGRVTERRAAEGFFLLGSVYGHYRETVQRIDLGEEYINSGIAIVVPSEKLVEMIEAPEEAAMRKQRYNEAQKRKVSTTADRAKRKLTAEEFQKTLERVSRRVSQPDQEKKGT